METGDRPSPGWGPHPARERPDETHGHTAKEEHHEELEAAASRLTCVAAGHYYTEKVFAEFLASYLKKRVPDTAFLLSQAETAPLRVL